MKVFGKNKRKGLIALCVLTMLLAFSCAAWADYDRFEVGSVSEIKLNNVAGAVSSHDFGKIDPTGSPSNSGYVISLDYADGPKWGTTPVDKVEFKVGFNFVKTDGSPGAPEPDNLITGDGRISFQGGKGTATDNQTFVLPGEQALTSQNNSFAATFTMNDIEGNDTFIRVKNNIPGETGPNVKALSTDIRLTRFRAAAEVSKDIAPTATTNSSGSTDGTTYGRLFKDSIYGHPNPKSSDLIPGSLKVTVTARGEMLATPSLTAVPSYWSVNGVKITPENPYGLTGVVAEEPTPENGGQIYHADNRYSANGDLMLEFTGTPTEAGKNIMPGFTISGTIATSDDTGSKLTDRLEGVSAYLELDEVLDSGLTLSSGLSGRLDFVAGAENDQRPLIIRYSNPNNTMYTTYGKFEEDYSASLFDGSGNDLFGGGSSGSNSILWNGLTVTRNKGATGTNDGTEVKFTFAGKPPADDSSSTKLYVGAKTERGGPYLFGPVYINIGTAVAPTLSASPSTLQLTPGTAIAAQTTVEVTSSTGSAVNITGIRESDSTSATLNQPIAWNGVTIDTNTGTAATVKVSGTPNIVGGKTFYLYDAASGRHAPLTINVTSPTAPNLVPSKTKIDAAEGTSVNTSVEIDLDPKGTITALTVTPTSEKGLNFTVSGTTINITGTPTSEGTVRVTVNGAAGSTPANPTFFDVVIAGRQVTTPALLLDNTVFSGTVGDAIDGTIIVTSATSGTVVPTGLSSDSGVSNVNSISWNGLTILLNGPKVFVRGRPTAAGTESFTVYGTVGGVAATPASFRVTVTAQSSSTTLFQDTSSWRANKYNYGYDLYLPVTQAFVSLFDVNKDGIVTTSEISDVIADIYIPYAVQNSLDFDMINDDNTSYGTLLLKFKLTPNVGHDLDWYVNMLLSTLNIHGVNGTTSFQTFLSGVKLEDVQAYLVSGGSSGGCSTGTMGLLALAMLGTAVIGRRRYR